MFPTTNHFRIVLLNNQGFTKDFRLQHQLNHFSIDLRSPPVRTLGLAVDPKNQHLLRFQFADSHGNKLALLGAMFATIGAPGIATNGAKDANYSGLLAVPLGARTLLVTRSYSGWDLGSICRVDTLDVFHPRRFKDDLGSNRGPCVVATRFGARAIYPVLCCPSGRLEV